MKFSKKIVVGLIGAIIATACLLLPPKISFAESTLRFDVGATVNVKTYPNGYVIHNFASEIVVGQDASLFVKEKIEAEFFQEKHGIFRIIPIIYSANGKTIHARLENISVADEKNRSLIFETSRFGKSVKIKIGDPQKTITGKQTYIVSYQIRDVLLRYNDHDEIYWNIAGKEWDTEIEKSSAIVRSDWAEITRVDCFLGQAGTKEKYCQAGFDKNSAHFYSQASLSWGQDFTIVVGLDKNNSIKFPGPIEKFLKLIADNWGYLFSFLPLVIIFLIWRKKGRDIKFITQKRPRQTSRLPETHSGKSL